MLGLNLTGRTCGKCEPCGNNTGLCDGISPGCSSTRTRRTCCKGIADHSRTAKCRFLDIRRDTDTPGENLPRRNPGECNDFRPRYYLARRDATVDTRREPLRNK